MRVRSEERLSCPELRPHRAKVKGIGFLEGNSEPLILFLDFLYRTWGKLSTSQYGIQNIRFCILSSDYLYEIFKKQL